jgi:hypothetical protein
LGIVPLLVPFALWPAFPAADYYGTSDAVRVSPPDLLGSVAGQPPTFASMDSARQFRRRLSMRPNHSLWLLTSDRVSQIYLSYPLPGRHWEEIAPVALGHCPTRSRPFRNGPDSPRPARASRPQLC